jgi:hypothetical protein
VIVELDSFKTWLIIWLHDLNDTSFTLQYLAYFFHLTIFSFSLPFFLPFFVFPSQTLKQINCLHGTESFLRSLASQEIHCLLWNPTLHYRAHKSPPPVPILSQINPIHTSKPDFPPTPRSSKWSVPFRLSNHNFVPISHLVYARCMPRPSHPPWSDHPSSPNIWWRDKLWSSSLCSFLLSPALKQIVNCF